MKDMTTSRAIIPQEILKAIELKEKERMGAINSTRFYSYLERNNGVVAIATVAVKSGKKFKTKEEPALYIKKTCIHTVGQKKCLLRDIYFVQMGGYIAIFDKEKKLDSEKKKIIVGKYSEEWWSCDSKYFRKYSSSNILNLDFLRETEEFRYCAWDKKTDLLDYLTAYAERPQIELIAKAIGSQFATSRPFTDKVNQDKEFVRWVLANKESIRKDGSAKVALIAYKYKCSIERARVKFQSGIYFQKRKPSVYGYPNETPLQKMYYEGNELLQEKIKAFIFRNAIPPTHYNDYIVALQYLNIDITDTKNVFPIDFEYWSRVRMDQYASKKAEDDAKKFKEITRKIRKVAKKYSSLAFTGKEYVVIISDSKQSLIDEGRVLEHCVGTMNYDQKILREESLIFFVRKANEVDKPYVTIEFSVKNGTICQSHAHNNLQPDEETNRFIQDEWKPFANKALNRLKRAQAA